MYPPTLILFLLYNVASSVEIPEVNAKRYPGPRIVVLGTAGVGKSVFANALFNRSSDYKPPGTKKCFEGGLVDHENGNGGKTQEACIESGYFLGDEKNGEITVVDTPGLGMNSFEEQASTETIVQTLKAVEYVHTFAMLYKEGDNRATRERLAVFDHYNRIFGKKFLKNVIIVATHWGYEETSVHRREKNLKEWNGDWLKYQKQISGFDKLEYADELKAIYFEPWDLIHDDTLRYKSYDNLRKLHDLSLENEPFHCQDIEVVLDINSQNEIRIKNLTSELDILDDCRACKKEKVIAEKTSKEKDVQIGKNQTKMIGLGIGSTILGIIIGFLTFRFYKMYKINNTKYDVDEEDHELRRD